MTKRVLDRLPSPVHPRMALFAAHDHLAEAPERSTFWSRGVWLDQGETGHCVAFAITDEAAASPVRVKGLNESSAHEAYYEIKRKGYDPFGLEDGSTVDAGAKLGRDRGWWSSWVWAKTRDELIRAIAVGPLILGTDWMTGMFTPDSDGVIAPTGVVEGGHAYCVDGRIVNYRYRGPHYRIEQSWGRTWGLNGRAYIHENDLLQLIANGGECAVVLDRKLGV